ncbi:MAG: LamG-like jellyroll fold domain-containing protein [Planctomycetota bacterium]|jgi:hypothetical protein
MNAKLFFPMMLVLVLWAPYGFAWTIDDVVSYWSFDEGSGATAYDSAGSNDGTLVNGPTWTTGQLDGALSFDDVDDYVEVPDDPSLRFTQYDSFSVSFWAKPSTGGYVFSKLNASPQSGIFGYALRWLSDTNKFQFMTQKSGINNVFVDTSNNSVHPGIWYYGTAVYDNKNMKVYLNGELKGTNFFGLNTGSTSPDNNFAIGVRLLPSILEQYFGGIIDDVIIFNKALSAEEIQQLYLSSVNNLDFVVIQIKNAIFEKIKAIERIDAALEQEWAAYDAFKELLETGDYGDLKKGDIVTAMQNTHSSIQHQQQSKAALQKSIEKLLYSLSTLGYGPQPPGSNWPPYVTITQPEDGAVFTPSQTIEIEADALDFDSSVVMVEFFANGNIIGEDNDGTDGWTTNWSDHLEGTYSLTAQATDNEGATTTSPAVEITVFVPPPTLWPPPPWPPLPPGPRLPPQLPPFPPRGC